MKLLLDTHIAMWYAENAPYLSAKAKETINTTTNEIFLSNASLIEMSLKMHLGKIDIKMTIEAFHLSMLEQGFSILPISIKILTQYIDLPIFEDHRDPFDKLIIATAIEQNLTIITADKKFVLYSDLVKIIT